MSTEVQFGIIDVSAKRDSVPASSDLQAFASLDDLKRTGLISPHAATGEDFQWLLDGSYDTFPDDPEPSQHWGWFSQAQSDADGVFQSQPTLTILFTRPHSSAGITLYFADLCPYDIHVQWFDLGGALMDEKDFQTDGSALDAFLDNPVYDYGKLVIRFLSSGLPHRYVRVYRMEYGLMHTFVGEEIAAATIFEEIDPTLSTLPDNTLNLEVMSRDVSFSILEPKGVYTMLTENQPMSVYRNGVYFGMFYLNEWEVSDMWIKEYGDETEPENWTKASFQCISAIGALDKIQVLGGVYSNTPLSALVAEIMADTAIDYVIDESLMEIPINGWIPICSARTALQQIAFAANAIVDCSRSSDVRIRPRRHAPAAVIGKDRKVLGSTVKLAPFVSGVEVVGHTYTMVTADAAGTLFTGKLGEGDHRVEFGTPAYSLVATNCAIQSFGSNYALVRVTAAQGSLEQKITGKTYNESTSSAKVGDLLNRIDNVVNVTDATLVSPEAAPIIAQRLYDYYQQRHISESGVRLGTEACEDRVSIFAAEQLIDGVRVTRSIAGRVLEMEMDLLADTVERMVIRGVAE